MRNANSKISLALFSMQALLVAEIASCRFDEQLNPQEQKEIVSVVGFREPFHAAPRGPHIGPPIAPGNSSYYVQSRVRIVPTIAGEPWIELRPFRGGTPLGWVPMSRIAKESIATYKLNESTRAQGSYDVRVAASSCQWKDATYCRKFTMAGYDYATCSVTSKFTYFEFHFHPSVAVRDNQRASAALCDFISEEWLFFDVGEIVAITDEGLVLRKGKGSYTVDLVAKSIHQ